MPHSSALVPFGVLAALLPLLASCPLGAQSPASPPLGLARIADGFDALLGISHAGDDRIFLVEKDFGILIGDKAGLLEESIFLDLRVILGSGTWGTGGILSVAFHPEYDSNGYFYIYYVDLDNDSVIARYERSLSFPNTADPNSGVVLLTIDQPFGAHFGGQIQFGPDGYLYVVLGDGGPGGDPDCRTQDLSLLQGKMLRLDVNQNIDAPPFYGAPADNPFVGPGDPPDEVWAIGFRNPWRFSFDRLSGDLYIGDVGEDSWEEINFQPAGGAGGENYGWKIVEGSSCFTPDPVVGGCPVGTPTCDFPGFTAPIIEYSNNGVNCSVIGGYVYRGSDLAPLTGNYLYGDWCSGNLWAASENQGVWSSELLEPSLPGLVTFGEDAQGEIYLSDGATLYRLVQSTVFADGFESGDPSGWSRAVP